MTDESVARVRRVLPAPPEVVFDHWLDPESLADWMCPRPSRCVAIVVEPRVGGTVRFDVDDAGTLVLIIGRFLRLDRPHGLSFTWSHSGWADPTAASVVDVSFTPSGADETLMTIEHRLLPPEGFDDHRDGWSVVADQLADALVRTRSDPGT